MGHIVVQRGGGAGGGGSTGRDLIVGTTTLDWTPNDPTVVSLREDFNLGSISSGSIAELGWKAETIGAAPTIAQLAGVVPNVGLMRLTTGASLGNGGAIDLAQSAVGPFGNMAGTALWDSFWIFRLPSNANVRFRCGFAIGSGLAVGEPTDGIWLRFDTSAGFTDTNFRVNCRAASTTTDTDTTVAVNTNFNKVRIRSDVAGTVVFNINGGADISISTNVPTAAMSPWFCLLTDTSATKSADADFFSFKWRGLSR